MHKAFEALSIHDYFKARKLFYKCYRQKPESAAAYGLASIFSRNNNPFFHPDSAVKYASAAIHLSAGDTTQKRFGEFLLNRGTMRQLADSLGQKKLNLILPQNDVALLNRFLKDYAVCSRHLLETARQKRDELLFRSVQQTNHSSATHAFIISHPYSSLLNEAFLLKEKQIYEETTASRDAASYRNYIRLYPDRVHVLKAYRELLSVLKKNKSASEIYDYIRTYPNSPQLQEAWETLFTLSVSTYSDEELQNFLKKYPDFPFKNSIISELQLNKQILIPVNLNSKIGFADTSGKIWIQPEYDETGAFQEGLCVVQKGDSVYYINKENKMFLNRFFDEALPFHNGIAAVKQSGKWFFINRMGEQVGDTLDEINPLSNESYVCRKKEMYGSYTMFGEPETPFKYEKMGDFVNQAAYYQKKNLFGFITKNGYVHEAEFDWISEFNTKGQAIFRKGSLFGIIRQNGQVLLDPSFDRILIAPGNLYLLIRNHLYGFYSAEGCYLTEVRYLYKPEEKPEHYTNGRLLKLIQKDKISVCDLNGKTIAEPGLYQEIYMNDSELLRVVKNGKYGFIQRKGQLSIPLKFSEASDFADSVAIIKTKKHYSIIHQSGKEIFTSDYEIEQTGYNIFSTENDNEETVYVDAKGNILPYKIKNTETFGNYQILYLENDSIKILTLP